MSNVIDNRVVEMRFDNEQFEKGVQQSMGTLDKLKQALNFSNVNVADKINFGSLSGAVSTISEKFSAFEAIATGALMRIGAQAVDAGEKLVKSFTIDQLSAGWQKYENKTTAVQTIMAATASQFTDTGEQMEYVNSQLDKLNWFTDETSYNFVDMVSNIGKFTSNGIKLDEAVTSMQGIATWAAISGQNAQTASRAMYNLAQAIGTGSVKLIDWRSIENANMATVEFKQSVLEAAVNTGKLKKSADGLYKTAKGTTVSIQDFNSALSEGWFDKGVLQQVLDKYGAATDKLYDLSEGSGISATNLLRLVKAQKDGTLTTQQLASALGDSDMSVSQLRKGIEQLASSEYDLGIRSLQAAQEAKTFTEAIDATKDAVSTGWMKSFELMFGDYEHAKVLWTDVANSLWDIFASGSEARNALLEDWGDSNWKSLEKSIKNAGISVSAFEEKVKDVLKEHRVDVDALIEEYGSLSNAIEQGAISSARMGTVVREVLNSFINTPGMSLASAEEKLKDIQSLVDKIWAGSYGNGADRKKAIEALGYDYDEIQKLVNKGKGYKIQITDIEFSDDARQMLEDILSDYERLNNLIGEGGREMLAEGIINSLTALSDIVVLVREEWDEFFGSLESDTLKALTERFRDFTASLRLFDDEQAELTATGEKVKAVLDKVFTAGKNVFDIFKQGARIVGDFVRSLAPVKEAVGGLANSLLDLFNSVTGRFSKFLETVDLTEEFAAVSATAADAINFLTGKVDELRVKFESWKPGDVFDGIREKLSGISAAIGEFFKTTEDGVTPFQKITNAVQGFIDKIKNIGSFLKPVKTFFTDLWAGIKDALDLSDVTNIFEGIAKLASNLIGSLKKILSNFSAGDIGKAAAGFLGVQLLRLGKIIPDLGSDFDWLVSTVRGAFKQISGILGNFRSGGLLKGVFGSGGLMGALFPGMNGANLAPIVRNIKAVAESLLMLGGALLMIAVAVAIFSAIKPEKLVAGISAMVIALGSVGTVLVGLSTAVTALKINPATLVAVAASILIVSAALLVLAAALAAFALVAKMKTMWEGFAAMAASLILVSAALGVLAKVCNGAELLAVAASLLIVSAALVVLAAGLAAFAAVAMMPSMWEGFGAMAASLGLVSIALGALSKICNGVELIAAAAAILVVSVALVVMAVALGAFTLIANQGVAAAAGLLTMVAVLVALTAALVILSGLGPSILIGAAALVAAAVAVVAIAAGLAAAAVAIAALGVAIGAAILAVGVGVGGAVAAIALGISTALIAISAGVTAVVAAIAASVALLGAGLASAVESLGTGIGVAVTGVGTGIGAAIEAVGAGIGGLFEKIGEGIANGISKISDAIGGIGDDISNVGVGVENFGVSVNTLSLIDLIGIAKGLMDMAKAIKEINKNKFTADATGINDYANALSNLSTVSTTIASTGETIKAAMSTLGTEVTTNLATGIQNGMANVTAAATTVITNLNVSFSGAIAQAASSGTQIGTNFVSGITSGISGASSAGRSLAQAAVSAVSSVQYQFRSIGYNFSAGLASGISSGSGIVSSAVRSVVNAAVSAARSAAQVRSPSRVFSKIGSYFSLGMAKGITSEAGTVAEATDQMVNNAIDSVTLGMAAIADKLSQDIDDEITITPVLDLSRIESSSRQLSSMLSDNNYSFNAAGNIAAQYDQNQLAASQQQTVVATIDPAALAAIANSNTRTGSPKVEVNFTGSLAQLGAVLQPVIVAETDRLGPSLINA